MQRARAEMELRTVKLKTHGRNFSEEDLIVNLDSLSRDKLPLASDDIIELLPPSEPGWPQGRLLLQVKDLSAEIQSKGGPLSVSEEVARVFCLGGVREVRVGRVEREDVGLDLLELRFMDQCLTQSDMWRLSCSLNGRCLYVGKKVEFAGIRTRVLSLWAQGSTRPSGAITYWSRVVFRSASSHVFLFIQVSSEMLLFDPSGDLYFDKAIGGFLNELFVKWKEQRCHHEVTLTLTARLHYPPQALETLPLAERDRLSQDKQGRFYQDFYKVVVEGETAEEWGGRIVTVKRSFLQFQKLLDSYQENGATLSLAKEGNILEAVNLAIGVFERHYIDCSFQRCGQQVLLISPGAGVFEVDQDLTRLTRERVIDGGIGVDLVCLTAQPLHAIPLFRFQSRELHSDHDFYHIPHWINYSFYNLPRPWAKLRFSPQIQLSDHLVNVHLNKERKSTKLYNPSLTNAGPQVASQAPLEELVLRVDYDEHDSAIFQAGGALPVAKVQSAGKVTGSRSSHQLARHRSTEEPSSFVLPVPQPVAFQIGGQGSPDDDDDDPFSDQPQESQGSNVRGIEIKASARRPSRDAAFSSSLKCHRSRVRSECADDASLEVASFLAQPFSVGSAETRHRLGSVPHLTSDPAVKRKRAFINPFDPSKVHTEITAYHRRWMHAFPRTAAGSAFQAHHAPTPDPERGASLGESGASLGELEGSLSTSGSSISVATPPTALRSALKRGGAGPSPPSGSSGDLKRRRGLKLLFSIEPRKPFEVRPKILEDFANVRRVGMDWKSLTEPACLPITTDFFPSKSVLMRDYFEYPSKIVVFNLDTAREQRVPPWRSDHQFMTTFQAFREMISQRIAQGFQLVFDPASAAWGHGSLLQLHTALLDLEEAVSLKRKPPRREAIVVNMSLGRVFHQIELTHPDIQISIYRAKENVRLSPVSYSYQLLSSNSDGVNGDTVKSEGTKVAGVMGEEVQGKSVMGEVERGEGERGEGERGEGVMGEGERGEGLMGEAVTATFCHAPVEEYNWNFLDQHICGYPDFDILGESQKSWSCRYLLLPLHPPGSPSAETPDALTSNFCRFLEFLNHIKRLPTARGPSLGSLPAATKQTPQLRRNNSLPARSPTSSSFLTPSSTPSRHGRKLSEIEEEHQSPRRLSPLYPSSSTRSSSRPSSPLALGRRGRHKAKQQAFALRKSRSKEDLASPALARHDQPRPPSPSHAPTPLGPHRSREDVIRELKGLVAGSPPQRTETAPLPSVTAKLIDSEPSGDSSFEAVSEPSPTSSPAPPRLTKTSPSADILAAMEDTGAGVDFLTGQSALRGGCFVALEAISWAMDCVDGVESRADAIRVLQRLLDDEVVVHASGDTQIPLIDGFFLYCALAKERLEEPSRDVLEQSYLVIDSCDFDKFTKRWFEVEIQAPTSLSGSHTPSPSSTSPSSSSIKNAYYMEFEQEAGFKADHRQSSIPASMTGRYVEVNPDPQLHSDRPEWCSVHYDHAYFPSRAFQFEFQWMVATVSLFHKMVQSWVHKASMCGFSLVPVPTLSPSSPHPFHRPHLLTITLPEAMRCQWRESAVAWNRSMTKLFAAITTKCGFLLDPSSVPAASEELLPLRRTSSAETTPSQVFVHHSGCALVRPVWGDGGEGVTGGGGEGGTGGGGEAWQSSLSNPVTSSTPVDEPRFLDNRLFDELRCGFVWYRNRLQPRQRGGAQPARHEAVLADLTALCADRDGALTLLCTEVLS